MKDETGCVVIEEFVEFKPKMHSLLVVDISEHKKFVDKILVGTKSHEEYEDVWWNNTFLRHSMNRTELLKSRYFVYLTLMIQYTSSPMKTVILVTIKKSFLDKL